MNTTSAASKSNPLITTKIANKEEDVKKIVENARNLYTERARLFLCKTGDQRLYVVNSIIGANRNPEHLSRLISPAYRLKHMRRLTCRTRWTSWSGKFWADAL